ncbi:hypothetical protein AMAG_10415 [Allomyces macrogynus ATCC 38327]|uniref:Transcription factor spt8 beta-propeller domain-containing protein n=1 Tax=Allomyces macrogynus (strain ATCC 38327) TaxID=578462 RepID=A0A0L0SUM2_ALLM3|nr:hypothetical protein AMAG_10415 [Allomyces macrogynus ATCC 38327]|eukprot:KNE66166.1 hypothetical protein AMAG_10415 [Allomyces macrogynus ATCC 38327]
MDDDVPVQCLGYDVTPVALVSTPAPLYSVAVTRNWKWALTGASDGRITKWDIFGTLNGKTTLTQTQKSGLVDTVNKGGHLLSFWYHEETPESTAHWNTTRATVPTGLGLASGGSKPGTPRPAPSASGSASAAASPSLGAGSSSTKKSSAAAAAAAPAPDLSPVYAIAVHSEAQWALAGSRRGGIMLYSVRHDEGSVVTTLCGHRDVVSVLTLANDDMTVLSGSWDSKMVHWDLNSGVPIRTYAGHIAQISSAQWHPTQPHMFLASAVNGRCGQWDTRVPGDLPVVKFPLPEKTPPWILSSCFNPISGHAYIGRRNHTVDVYERDGGLLRTLALPRNSGPVSKVLCMENGRSLMIGSSDNVRQWDLEHTGKGVPFTIIPGHHGGNLSEMLVDSDCRFMITASGSRGWDSAGKDTAQCLIYTVSSVY